MAHHPLSFTVYTLDQNRIELGDVLLTRAPHGCVSQIIQKATKSRFSHAALCIRYGLFIEAIDLGVCRLAIMATGAHAKENIRLLRLDKSIHDASEKAKAAARRGEYYLSRGYSLPGAVGVKIAKLRSSERAALFCSQLVARAYEEIGVQIVPGKTPETTAPGDLLGGSSLLDDVTEEALISVETGAPPSFYLDDASLLERPHHYEIRAKLCMLYSTPVQRVLSQLKEKPNCFHELEIVLTKSLDPKLDKAIVSELSKRHFAEKFLQSIRKYANPKEVEKVTNTTLDRIERGNVSDEELCCIIRDSATIRKQLEEDVNDRREEHMRYEKGYSNNRLVTFGYFASLQKQLLKLSIECLNAKTHELNALIPEAQRRGLEPGPPS